MSRSWTIARALLSLQNSLTIPAWKLRAPIRDNLAWSLATPVDCRNASKDMIHALKSRIKSKTDPDAKIRNAVTSPKVFQRRSKRRAILRAKKIQTANTTMITGSEADTEPNHRTNSQAITLASWIEVFRLEIDLAFLDSVITTEQHQRERRVSHRNPELSVPDTSRDQSRRLSRFSVEVVG